VIRLVRADLDLLDAALAGDDSLSTRVLEKAGFRYDGEARERGELVWRFSRRRA
jgi:RimJ/RimL family protein N-acetyltransferase